MTDNLGKYISFCSDCNRYHFYHIIQNPDGTLHLKSIEVGVPDVALAKDVTLDVLLADQTRRWKDYYSKGVDNLGSFTG